MLYSLLTAVIILSFLMPILSIWCFIKGYNLKADKLGEKRIETPKMPQKRPKTNKEYATLMCNIDAFDGTAQGQKEFK